MKTTTQCQLALQRIFFMFFKKFGRQDREKADALENVLICGRLGEYRYYDMDQAIGRAMKLASGILEKFTIEELETA